MESLNLSSGETEVLFGVSGLGNGLSEDEKYLCWCLITLYIKNRFFSFDRKNDELMTFGELIYLRDCLDSLLSDQYDVVEKIGFIEPDLEFVLYPKLDLRTQGNMWVRKGEEIRDIYLQMAINLADMESGYNGQSFILPLCRNEIMILKQYISDAIPRLEWQWEKG